jgi:glutamate synthase (NADPH/NADH) large chain
MKYYRLDLADYYTTHGLYDPSDEHDACGVGLVAATDGKARRDVVDKAIAGLGAVWHRGAVNADGKTGDGAGIHLQIPHTFLASQLPSYNQALTQGAIIGVGMLFLPRTDAGAQEVARLLIETEINRMGYRIIAWRQVPINPQVIGEDANVTRPEVMQVCVRKDSASLSYDDTERDLYIIRRRIETALRRAAINDCYICSFSCRTIVYKGLFQAAQLTNFYPELSDPLITSAYAVFHQRFSTNTAPSWAMAQPFRTIAHNGEINTLRGNVNWMSSYEACFGADLFADYSDDITPIVPPSGSDTAMLDSVVEFVTLSGKSLPFAKLMMIPPAWSKQEAIIPAHHRALYEYLNCLMSPWDGPAAIVGSDGKWVIAGTDRNGLRPLRYALTTDGLLTIGSEAGMVEVESREVIALGQLAPGELIGVQLQEGVFYNDAALKDALASAEDYASKIAPVITIDANHILPMQAFPELKAAQYAAGYSQEEIDMVILPMVQTGKEAVGSMGDDTPLAALSQQHRGLHHFFRQHFSQVTNPPIDPLRETHTMSLLTRVGQVKDILGDTPNLYSLVQLDSPILMAGQMHALLQHFGTESTAVLDCTYPVSDHPHALRAAIDGLLAAADTAIADGAQLIVLCDQATNHDRMAIPAILAAAAVHTHMVKQSKRKQLSIISRTAHVTDTHSMAVLIGVGATAVYPYLMEATALALCAEGKATCTPEQALENLTHAYGQGLLKIMSKMGISVVSSYRGGRNFDAIGLSRSLVAEFFPGLVSRISGIGLSEIHQRQLALHREAYHTKALPVGGFYRYRARGEQHAYEGDLIHRLQTACATGSYNQYKDFSRRTDALPAIHVRSLLRFESDRAAIAIAKVESVQNIRKRFVAPAMSLGSLSPEAHETLAIAMNRIGAASNSGEGGEGAERYHANIHGDNPNSSIKQVASGRFGVTADYLNHCNEIQIKIAQGAKPGEGGQLPAFKVTAEIARLRHTTEGTTLISPPPHHDIYSIEDLAQLIYDLKQINPRAIVSVKLVAQSGIGTIASGVVKAMADKIIISGHVGGTGASPLSSIKYAGAPWEMGLAEVSQVLAINKLRHRVRLQTDGGLKTGRDIVIAAMLGADEYAIGTLSLVAMGCLLVRQCHSNTCPVGICTQDEGLRKHFDGTPEKVIHLMSFIAQEVQEILAELGYSTLDEIIGRTDLLRQITHAHPDINMLDLTPLLTRPSVDIPFIHSSHIAGESESVKRDTVRGKSLKPFLDSPARGEYIYRYPYNAVPPSLDAIILAEAGQHLHTGKKVQLSYTVHNTQRSIGTHLSHHLLQFFPAYNLEDGTVTLALQGTAGQSLGAFLIKGITIDLQGDANDYVGKGLSGGIIIVRPAEGVKRTSQDNAIIGNTVLYGATSGMLFAAGRAGERFGVRNSGATAIIEGCGSNGCEYMTGGIVVILGKIGVNFAAGMTGGMAFVYDEGNTLPARINTEHVSYTRLNDTPASTEDTLRLLITQHCSMTHSSYAANILAAWHTQRTHFWVVTPN